MDEEEITHILESALSADPEVRTKAEGVLRKLEDQNFIGFLYSLSLVLSYDHDDTYSCRLAGVVLKNRLVNRWLSSDAPYRSQVKRLLLETLGSEAAAALVVAKIASIEIPRKEWPQLIPSLLKNVTHKDQTASLKQATLIALGYVCEEISHNDLAQNEVSDVLTAVVRGMNATEPNSVRLAATTALNSAIGFAETKFKNEQDRNDIMKAVCETARAEEADVRQAAFECLVSIASTYSGVLEPYMLTLLELTENAVKGNEEGVALQAIELWRSMIELQDGDIGSNVSKMVLLLLVPLLLETLMKQEEEEEEEDGIWNLSMSGRTCLGRVAQTVGDRILPFVIPFVESGISKPDWRSREAAVYAFGSVLEGPSVKKLFSAVISNLDLLLEVMQDKNSQVKGTTKWTLGRIFKLLLHSHDTDVPLISDDNMEKVMLVLLGSIDDSPEKVCGAIYSLAQGYGGSCVFTQNLSAIISSLKRTCANDAMLTCVAYETLIEVVRCCDLEESVDIIASLLTATMSQLEQTIELPSPSSGDLLSLLCGVMQVIILKFGSHDVTKTIILDEADEIWSIFFKVFASSSTVHREAMLAVGALACAIGPEFIKYMFMFYKYLQMGLKDVNESQVCSVSVGVVGDICRALGDKIFPYCDNIMTLLIKDLASFDLHRSVKPSIFLCFGDVALAIGERFEEYVENTMQMMHTAVKVCEQIDQSYEEMMEFGNQLKRSIFEAYSGILQGLKGSKAEILLPHASHLLKFVELVAEDANRDVSVVIVAVAALGDLADALCSHETLLKDLPFCKKFLGECLESNNEQLKVVASWTEMVIRRMSSACGFGY